MNYPRIPSYEEAELYLKNTTPNRNSGVVPLRRDRTRSRDYSIRRINGGIAARMYSTNIVTWMEDGRIIVSDYDSPTTIKVQNKLLYRVHIYTRYGLKHMYRVGAFNGPITFKYGEGGVIVAEPDGIGYFYGPGRKFLDPTIREFYQAMQKFITVAETFDPHIMRNKYYGGWRTYGNLIEEDLRDIKALMDKYQWKPGMPLEPDLFEEAIALGNREDPLGYLKRAKYEYKGTSRDSPNWRVVSYHDHVKNQEFLTGPIKCSIVGALT